MTLNKLSYSQNQSCSQSVLTVKVKADDTSF